MSYLLFYLVPSAFLMVAFISWVLTRAVGAKTGIDATIVLLLLGMMVAMLVGPAYLYLTTFSFGLGDLAIWEIAVFMMVGMMPIGVLLFAKSGCRATRTGRVRSRSRIFSITFLA